jgi:hypothetical protein
MGQAGHLCRSRWLSEESASHQRLRCWHSRGPVREALRAAANGSGGKARNRRAHQITSKTGLAARRHRITRTAPAAACGCTSMHACAGSAGSCGTRVFQHSRVPCRARSRWVRCWCSAMLPQTLLLQTTAKIPTAEPPLQRRTAESLLSTQSLNAMEATWHSSISGSTRVSCVERS